MKVSRRIKFIAGLIKYDTAADIGTGDGLTMIYALKTGRIKHAVACDVNAGPVEIAKKNAREHGADGIEFRQCAGFDGLLPGDAETIVISGMGGVLTAEILRNAGQRLNGVKQLVLQPQSAVPEVRRSVHAAGFKIVNELMLKERGKFYIMLDCSKGAEDYSEQEYLFGKFLPARRDEVFIEYLKNETRLLEDVVTRIKDGEDIGADAVEKLREIEELLARQRNMICNGE